MTKRLDLNDVSIYYGGFHTVQNVNLHVPPRSVTAFIGPFDCGKSTVLRSLNRMHEVIPGAYATGEMLPGGENIYDPKIDLVSVRNTIGMMFWRPDPFPTMSIEDNVVAGLELTGVKNKAHFREVAEKSLYDANLWDEVKDHLNKPGGGLSDGQRQHLCITRAIAVEPEVLLVDGPCPALDPISTLAAEDLIHELKVEFTIVVVTHNMQQVAHVSNRTAFSSFKTTGKSGHLIEVDPTKKIFENPERKETENYISGRFG